MKVANVLRVKGTSVMTITPRETVQVAAKRFRQEGVGALIVTNGNGAVEGIITERDVSNGLAEHGGKVHALPVSALMATTVVTCYPEESIMSVAKVMTERRLRHLLVKDGPQLVGVVSIGDVLKNRLDEMQLEVSVLRDIAIANR